MASIGILFSAHQAPMITLPLLMTWFGCVTITEVRKRPGQLLTEVSLNLIQLTQVFSVSSGKKFGKRKKSLQQIGSIGSVYCSRQQCLNMQIQD